MAELCNRTPIIYWGPLSRYSRIPDEDSFGDFFLNPTANDIHRLTGRNGLTFFPNHWNADNLLIEYRGDIKITNEPFKITPLEYFNRSEDVVIYDYVASIAALTYMIPSGHSMHRKDLYDIYQYLLQKYISVRSHITEEVDRQVASLGLDKQPFVAVHLRGGGKALEDPTANSAIARLLAMAQKTPPEMPVLTLSDNADIIARARDALGDRLIESSAEKTEIVGKSLHFDYTSEDYRYGFEAVVDTYLATRASRFFGNGSSAFSAAIGILKNWGPGDFTLLNHSVFEDVLSDLYLPQDVFHDAMGCA